MFPLPYCPICERQHLEISNCGAEKYTVAQRRIERIMELEAENKRLMEFTPTTQNINALPEKLRSYIHALSTRCDPAGEVQELVCLRENVKALEVQLANIKDYIKGCADMLSGEGILAVRIKHAADELATKNEWYQTALKDVAYFKAKLANHGGIL